MLGVSGFYSGTSVLDGVDGLHLHHVDGNTQGDGSRSRKLLGVIQQMSQRANSFRQVSRQHGGCCIGSYLQVKLQIVDLVDTRDTNSLAGNLRYQHIIGTVDGLLAQHVTHVRHLSCQGSKLPVVILLGHLLHLR